MAGDTKYSRAISIPQYEVKGDRPFIEELYSNEKVIKLLDHIKKSGVSDSEKKFLTIAAYRHYVFNYDRIAEYYAGASKEMQELMEESALVSIDIEKDIKNGYVKYSKRIQQIIEDSKRAKEESNEE